MVRYYHAAAGFPVKETWVKARDPEKAHAQAKGGNTLHEKQLLSELLDDGKTLTFKSKQRDIMVKIFDTNDELAMKVLRIKWGGFPRRRPEATSM